MNRIRRKGKKQQTQKPLVQESMEGKTLHRFHNSKCNKLFENPGIEIIHVTEPPTEKLICPYCYTPLTTLQEGELKIGKMEEIEFSELPFPAEIIEEEEEKPTWKYDIIVHPHFVAELTELLEKKGFKPLLSFRDNTFHIEITIEKELNFKKSREAGKVLKWTRELVEK
jgi:hypothetical protein